MDDASGVEGAWRAETHQPGGAAMALLRIAGDSYLPFLEANAAAVAAGAEAAEATVPEGVYRQPPFRYQAKCLAALQARYRELPEAARRQTDPILAETGCLQAFAEAENA